MTEIELLEHVLGNLKAGKNIGSGLLFDGKPSEDETFHQLCSTVYESYGTEEFTLAPRTHIVNTFEVPAPESDELKDKRSYYIPCHMSAIGYRELLWMGSKADRHILKNKQVFITKEAAILNQKAQAGIDPYGEES